MAAIAIAMATTAVRASRPPNEENIPVNIGRNVASEGQNVPAP